MLFFCIIMYVEEIGSTLGKRVKFCANIQFFQKNKPLCE